MEQPTENTENNPIDDVFNAPGTEEAPGTEPASSDASGENQPTAPGAEAQPQPQPQPSVQELVTQAVQSALAQQQPQQAQQPPPRQYTPEELDRVTNKFRVGQELADAFVSGEPTRVVAALQTLVDGATKHAITVARMLNEHSRGQLMNELQPHIEFAQQQRDAAAMQHYLKKYPKHQGFVSLVDAEAKRIAADGSAKGKTADQVIDLIGSRVDQILGQLTAQNGVQTPQRQQQQTQPPKMSTVSTGGQGGAGNKPSTASDDMHLSSEQRAALSAW